MSLFSSQIINLVCLLVEKQEITLDVVKNEAQPDVAPMSFPACVAVLLLNKTNCSFVPAADDGDPIKKFNAPE
jgi:hypothetical protein